MKIDRFVSEKMSRQKIPGMAVALVKNGEAVVAKGYGFANLERQVPVTTTAFSNPDLSVSNSPLLLSCSSKNVGNSASTTTSSQPVADEGTMGSITIRQLLAHTSGLPEYEDEIDSSRDASERQLKELWDYCWLQIFTR